MKKEQANEVIYNAINMAISKGCYNLEETSSVIEALRVILNEDETNEDE